MNSESFHSFPSGSISALIRRQLMFASVAASILASFDACAADWARFRGPNGSGIAPEAKPPVTWSDTQNVRWKTELPGPGTSSPIVVGDRVFVTCYSGYGEDGGGGDMAKLQRHLVCVDRSDGKIAWSSAVPAVPPEDSYSGYLTEHGYASHTPASDGERVYVFFGKSGAAAFDLTGAKLWQTSLGTDSNRKNWGSGSSPILYKDFVIINASEESHAIVALEKKTGKVAWRAEGDALEYSFGTPVLAESEGRTDLVFSVPGQLWGLDPDTGKLRWFAETGLPGNIAPSVIAGDGVVYAFGGFPKLGALAVRTGGKDDVTKTHILWTGSISTYVPTPVLHEGRLYFVSDAGFATCLGAKTGSVVFKERVPGASAAGRGGKPFYASAVFADGLVYAVSRQNGTFVFEAKPEFKLVAENKLAGDESQFNATPAIADRQLFLRSNRALYCIEAAPSGDTENAK
ncbi:MAG: PQQ-binding-like beta-propeller repeat protein [Chthoniobacteraceae bacterium]